MRLDYGPCIVQDAAIIEFENQVHITNFKIKENQTVNKQPGWNASCPSYWGEKSTTVKKKSRRKKTLARAKRRHGGLKHIKSNCSSNYNVHVWCWSNEGGGLLDKRKQHAATSQIITDFPNRQREAERDGKRVTRTLSPRRRRVLYCH